MRRSFLIIVVIIAVALVSGAGYIGYLSSQPTKTPAIVAPDTVAVTTCDVEQTVTAPGNLVNTQEYTVDMPVDGRLAEVLVRPGDRVEAGQILARLGDREKYTSAVAAARLELLQAQHDFDQLLENAPVDAAEARLAVVEAQAALDEAQDDRERMDFPRANETTIATARAHVEITESTLKAAKKAYKRVSGNPAGDPQRARALAELNEAQRAYDMARATLGWYEGHATEQEIAEADAQLALAQTQLEQAENEWTRLKNGLDALTVDLAEAAIENAQATLDEAEAALEKLEITAPFAGVILEVNARQGQTVPSGTGLMVLNDPQAVEVEASVIEEDLPYVEVGQPVDLFFDALPDVEINGTIARILFKRIEGDRPLYAIFITLDHVPDKLIAGMTSDASIIIARQAGALCLPRALVGASPDGTAIVEVWTGESKEQRSVQVGLRGDVYVEILSGLSEGELVVSQ